MQASTTKMTKASLIHAFEEQFGAQPDVCSFSPGRVNLIGEHTDYNGGHVFPCAISLGTFGAIKQRRDKLLRLYSNNFAADGIKEYAIDDLSFVKADGWTNYVKGVIYFLQRAGYSINHGCDIYINGEIPNGSGLSSSASLELLIGVLVKALFGLDVAQLDLVKIGKKVENDFIGVNSGIMDQFAVGMGKKDHAIYLDTNTLNYQYLPVKLADATLVIMNTNHRRELAGSKYNERRSQCEAALADLQAKLPELKTLGALNVEQFDEYRYAITDKINMRRALHAVSENERTQVATKVLAQNDIARFGRLMNASHVSLQDDYEVTGKQLDAIVHAAWAFDGTLGARMTGAGFGGCAIALVKSTRLAEFKQFVAAKYKQAVGTECEFYVAKIADGTKIL